MSIDIGPNAVRAPSIPVNAAPPTRTPPASGRGLEPGTAEAGVAEGGAFKRDLSSRHPAERDSLLNGGSGSTACRSSLGSRASAHRERSVAKCERAVIGFEPIPLLPFLTLDYCRDITTACSFVAEGATLRETRSPL